MGDPQAWAGPVIAFILGGGLGSAVLAVFKARAQSRKINAEASALDLSTEAQAESMAMATMQVALTSAQTQNTALTERLVRAETALDAERDGRARDRREHRAEVEQLEARIAGLVSEVSQIQAEVADYRRANFGD